MQNNDSSLQKFRTYVHILYGLFALSLFFWVFLIGAIIFGIITYKDAKAFPVIKSHYDWLRTTFWGALLGNLIGIFAIFAFEGVFSIGDNLFPSIWTLYSISSIPFIGIVWSISIIVTIWFIYRIIKSWYYHFDKPDISMPQRLF